MGDGFEGCVNRDEGAHGGRMNGDRGAGGGGRRFRSVCRGSLSARVVSKFGIICGVP